VAEDDVREVLRERNYGDSRDLTRSKTCKVCSLRPVYRERRGTEAFCSSNTCNDSDFRRFDSRRQCSSACTQDHVIVSQLVQRPTINDARNGSLKR
jgi:hypothetical protein